MTEHAAKRQAGEEIEAMSEMIRQGANLVMDHPLWAGSLGQAEDLTESVLHVLLEQFQTSESFPRNHEAMR